MTSCFISHHFLSNFIDYHLKLIYSFPSQHYFALHLKGRWGGFFSLFTCAITGRWAQLGFNWLKRLLSKAACCKSQTKPRGTFQPSPPLLEILVLRDGDLGFHIWSSVVKQCFHSPQQKTQVVLRSGLRFLLQVGSSDTRDQIKADRDETVLAHILGLAPGPLICISSWCEHMFPSLVHSSASLWMLITG